MLRIAVTTREAETLSVEAVEGISVMEALRAAGVDEILAICGGCCSCATCHVYVDAEFDDLLPPQSEDESLLLDTSDHRNARSRLSCQIPVSAALDGLRVTVAPED